MIQLLDMMRCGTWWGCDWTHFVFPVWLSMPKKQPLLLPSIPSHGPANPFSNSVIVCSPKHMNIIEFSWMRIWVRGKPGGERTRCRAVRSDSRHFWNKMVNLWHAKWIISCLQNHTEILKTALWVLWDICAWVNLMFIFWMVCFKISTVESQLQRG